MYGVLGLLAVRAARAEGTRGVRWRVALMVLIAISLFGAIDEFHQRFIPGRGMELGDWIADSCGALLGIAAFTLFTMSRQPPVETPT
jgi:VanZ family protein